VGLPSIVNINGVTFSGNTAANDGGAIYWTQSDTAGHAITITGAVFTLNSAKGGTAEGGESERGGGAIYAVTDRDHDIGNLDLVLIVNGQFTFNTAPNGQGGAILLAGGQLSSIDLVTNPPSPQPAALFPANGGIVASDFSNNSAGGAAASDALGGAGGAIYARGNLSIEQSSFIGNASTNGSGGAIALRNTTTPNTVAFANVTFNGNSAKQAGGAIANIHPNGSLSLVNDTLSGNTANGDTTAGNTIAGGGAIYNANATLAAVGVRNSIFGASTPSVANCAGSPIGDLGNNLQYSPNTAGCGASMTIADPNLAAPSIFGGPNLFVKVMTINGNHSPAQGTGDQPTCLAQPILNFDATGLPAKRPAGDPSCDIGAFESGTTFPVELLRFGAD
jgi:predicted outer membrane repeat protein